MQFGPEMGPEIPMVNESVCGLAGNFDSGFFRSADGKKIMEKSAQVELCIIALIFAPYI